MPLNRLYTSRHQIIAKVWWPARSIGSYSPKTLAKDVPFVQGVGYAGFRDRKSLEKNIRWYLSGNDDKVENLNYPAILKSISKALEACRQLISFKPANIFLFPFSNKFVNQKMSGVAGYSLWKSTILVYIGSQYSRKALQHMLAHELCHAVSLNYMPRKTLADSLVAEGLAEHFREAALGGGRSPWVRSISRKYSAKLFKKLIPSLASKDVGLSQKIFFGTGNYPLWAGYAIGYHIVSDYIQKQKPVKWAALLKTPSKEVLERSGW